MENRTLALAAALALAGCGSAETRWSPGERVAVDPALSPAWREAIRASADAWCAATNGAGCLDLYPGVAWPGFHAREREDNSAGYRNETGAVDIDPTGRFPAAWQRVAAINHEIGHAFVGSAHQPHGLLVADMWEHQLPRAGCIDDWTLALFCAEHPCPNGVTPECVAEAP